MQDATATEYRHAPEAALKRFVTTVLTTVGIDPVDAKLVGEVLLAADVRGIESHGLARLDSFYVSKLRSGEIALRPTVTVVRETPTSILMDAGNGLGHPTAVRTMERVIEKAKATGAAFGAVRNSNHFGIAAYYAMLALDHDLIGIASTNSARYGAPTFGRDVLLGTNPLAFAVPADREPAFVLDFATTTVPRGKLEVYQRKELALHPGWAVDQHGVETLDPATALRGALLPLGGFGVDTGGHKGFGLGLLVDILCGVLAGGPFGTELPGPSDPPRGGAIGHFFGAFRIDAFRDAATFKADMDRELRMFKESHPVEGHDRVYVAGEIEHERTLHNRAHGVPVHVKVWNGLQRLAGELNVPFDLG